MSGPRRTDLARQRLEVGLLNDRCIPVVTDYTLNDYGEPVVTTTEQTATRCSVRPGTGKEVSVGDDVVIADATASLPLSYADVLKASDRIKVVERNGVTLTTPEEYRIVGEPERQTLTCELTLVRKLA
jgi:hypothetical protein